MFWEKLLHFQRGGLLVTQKPRAFFPRFALKASPSSPSGPGLLAAAPLGRRWVHVQM